jgi:hypothetical protein
MGTSDEEHDMDKLNDRIGIVLFGLIIAGLIFLSAPF